MAKVKHTKTELKAQSDALRRFQRFLPMLQLKKQQLQAELSAIAPSLYRCKGVLRVSNGTTEWVLLDWTPSEYSVKPFSGLRPRNGGVVLIAKRGMEGPAQNLVHSIERRGMRTG